MLVPALLLVIGCGDEQSTTPSGDQGVAIADMAVATDLGAEVNDAGPIAPACDPATCANGSCSDDDCVYEPGWTDPFCDAFAEPSEDGVAEAASRRSSPSTAP